MKSLPVPLYIYIYIYTYIYNIHIYLYTVCCNYIYIYIIHMPGFYVRWISGHTLVSRFARMLFSRWTVSTFETLQDHETHETFGHVSSGVAVCLRVYNMVFHSILDVTVPDFRPIPNVLLKWDGAYLWTIKHVVSRTTTTSINSHR